MGVDADSIEIGRTGGAAPVTVNFSDNAVTVGLSYLFGAPAAAAPVVAKY
jgi:hypothetical protein